MEDKIKKVFILAGGLGTRLKPLTNEIPKPMVEIDGKPLLEHVISLFKKYGVYDIILAVHYKKEKIMNYFKDGSEFGVKITYIEEKEPLGTAGALLLAKNMLNETFFMINADDLMNINLQNMLEFHRKNKAVATIALTKIEDTREYGVAKLEGDKIVEFVEKPLPEVAPSHLISSGLYILEPEVIDLIPKREGIIRMETEVFPDIAKSGKLYGYPFPGQWFDTGTLERYEQVKREWKGFE